MSEFWGPPQLPRNHPDRIRIAFDDPRLVANAGLLLPVTLAQHLGLREVVDSHVDLGDAPGRANPGDKLLTLVASALAGGDFIDDADVLRTGGTAGAIGCVVLLVAAGAIDPGDLLLPQFENVAKAKGAALAATNGVAVPMVFTGLLLLILLLRPIVARPRLVLVSAGEGGVVQIALDSVRQMAERTGGGNRSVKGLRCRVRVSSGGLRILCLADLNMGSDLPKVSSELQESIKDVVERLIGLAVVDVRVKAKYRGDGDLSLIAR